MAHEPERPTARPKAPPVAMAGFAEPARGKGFAPQAAAATAPAGGEDAGRVGRYLAAFGYLGAAEFERARLDPDAPGASGDELRAGLERFQRFNGLPQTGEPDRATLDLMARPRCWFPDAEIGEALLQGSRWPKTGLTYAFRHFPQDLEPEQVRDAIRQAFALWAAATPLTFAEVGSDGGPDVAIGFEGGGFPPDGAGGAPGDAMPDGAEPWSLILPPSGVDLVTVAAHEIGHALGLAHSGVGTALMAPFHDGPRRGLGDDDRARIRALYGAAPAPTGWSGWAGLGAPPVGFAGAPTVVSRNADVCNIYVRGGDNALWQQAFAGGRWHGWGRHNDGGVLASEPAPGTMGPDHEHVFVRGTDGQVWQKWWTGGGGWSGWAALGAPPGGFAGAPAVVSRNSTVCNIYVRGSDDALWQKAWFNNAWHGWGRHNDGGVLASEPAPGSMGPDHEHVFVRGTDGQVWQKWWTGGGWSGWAALGAPPGGFVGAPSAVSRSNSVCNVYVRGSDNALWQKAWFNNAWHPWGRHEDGGVLASGPAPGAMGPNHEHVFVRGTDNQVWQKWWAG